MDIQQCCGEISTFLNFRGMQLLIDTLTSTGCTLTFMEVRACNSNCLRRFMYMVITMS